MSAAFLVSDIACKGQAAAILPHRHSGLASKRNSLWASGAQTW